MYSAFFFRLTCVTSLVRTINVYFFCYPITSKILFATNKAFILSWESFSLLCPVISHRVSSPLTSQQSSNLLPKYFVSAFEIYKNLVTNPLDKVIVHSLCSRFS